MLDATPTTDAGDRISKRSHGVELQRVVTPSVQSGTANAWRNLDCVSGTPARFSRIPTSRGKGVQAAETSLATDIYQAFFYRGLSKVPDKKNRAAWDYDYACLLTYDTSEMGALRKAWKGFDKRMRDACWDAANVYVMILGS